MSYKVVDIYKDLPRTNCGDCGVGSCFAFASAVYLEGAPLARCPHLLEAQRRPMEHRLEAGRARGEGRRPDRGEQALAALSAEFAEADPEDLAKRCGGTLPADAPGTVEVFFLGRRYRLGGGDVVAAPGAELPTVWVKIFLLIYATRASGAPPDGTWIAYRELPNTVSKAKTFEGIVDRLARVFGDRPHALAQAAADLGGEAVAFGSAEGAWRFGVLPRVELLLLFWGAREEFSARASLLVDRGVLGYLDQEALCFLAEALVARLQGRGLAEVVP